MNKSRKYFITKITKMLIWWVLQFASILKVLQVTKDTLGSPGKNLAPSAPPKSALKSTLFHTLAFFQQFQSLQTPQKFIPSQASILFTISESVNHFRQKMWSGKISLSSVPFGTNIALYVKRSKMRLYISPGGHFKQLCLHIHLLIHF